MADGRVVPGVSQLDRIQQKVHGGEPLTDEEFRALEDAARAQPGPVLRLAVAHAMMNAEKDREAWPLLERLTRDFPRDVQVWLGLSRAAFALDRPADAERALKQAVA